MKLKPFDLEKARRGAQIVDRSGNKIREWHYFESLEDGQKLYCVDHEGELDCYTDEGRFYKNGVLDQSDLFLLPSMKQFWINIHRSQEGVYFNSSLYASEKDAKLCKHLPSLTYCATVLIEIENEEEKNEAI